MPLMVDRVPTLLHMTLNFLSARFTLSINVSVIRLHGIPCALHLHLRDLILPNS